MHIKHAVSLGLIASVGAFGCSGDSTATSARLMLAAGDSSFGSSAGEFTDEGGTVFTLQSAQLHLRKVELETLAHESQDDSDSDDCDDSDSGTSGSTPDGGATCDDSKDSNDDDGELELNGPFLVDLKTGTVTPQLQIPFGTYHEIKFKIEDGDPEDGLVEPGSPLDDKSFVAVASFEYNGQPLTLEVALDFDAELELESDTGIVVGEGSKNALFHLAASQWLQGVNITQCLASGGLTAVDGVVRIVDDSSGSTDCGAIGHRMEQNIKKFMDHEHELEHESGDDDSSDDKNDDKGANSGGDSIEDANDDKN